MPQRFPSVALIGATGNIGAPILQALQQAQPPFESITILTRAAPSNPSAYPPNVHVKVVDYASKDSLIAALTGVDALVSTIAAGSVAVQKTTIDAAVAAGVKFFVPSDFGVASTDARLNRDFANWASKVEIQEYLAGQPIDYALIFTGLFLDWGMHGFLLNLKNKTVELWDDGEAVLSLTTVGSIGRAVVAVLEGKADGKTEVRVKDINLSQRHLFELAQEAVGSDGWTVTKLDTEAAYALSKENVKNGQRDASYAFLKRAIVGGYGSLWRAEEDDSERLGLMEWTEKDVVELVKKLVEEE
ncbi:hypothetical protein B0T22DRAFT_493852 [Podospora appendiculata]|uniref:NmrA-like domain-containing protein n=1 Tax=Podospora appendiculata TaxID=314037 RepID=A0AAE1C7P8_9PEZI|nr:hypothetical protein B0T22DRAFT_493852 [Podospora appendiculata]